MNKIAMNELTKRQKSGHKLHLIKTIMLLNSKSNFCCSLYSYIFKSNSINDEITFTNRNCLIVQRKGYGEWTRMIERFYESIVN